MNGLGLYKLIGRLPVMVDDVVEWGRWYEEATLSGARRVAKTQVGPLYVSTVFVGIDHSFGSGPAKLFETMVFGGEMDGEFSDSYMDRYETWGEAEDGHAKAVAWAEERLAEAEASLKETR